MAAAHSCPQSPPVTAWNQFHRSAWTIRCTWRLIFVTVQSGFFRFTWTSSSSTHAQVRLNLQPGTFSSRSLASFPPTLLTIPFHAIATLLLHSTRSLSHSLTTSYHLDGAAWQVLRLSRPPPQPENGLQLRTKAKFLIIERRQRT